jgi:hypothetical protein
MDLGDWVNTPAATGAPGKKKKGDDDDDDGPIKKPTGVILGLKKKKSKAKAADGDGGDEEGEEEDEGDGGEEEEEEEEDVHEVVRARAAPCRRRHTGLQCRRRSTATSDRCPAPPRPPRRRLCRTKTRPWRTRRSSRKRAGSEAAGAAGRLDACAPLQGADRDADYPLRPPLRPRRCVFVSLLSRLFLLGGTACLSPPGWRARALAAARPPAAVPSTLRPRSLPQPHRFPPPPALSHSLKFYLSFALRACAAGVSECECVAANLARRNFKLY